MFPARAPLANSTELLDIQKHLEVEPGFNRSALGQGGYQMAALGVTMLIAIFSGVITGKWYLVKNGWITD